MRLLAPARISRKTEASTSVDTQLEAVARYAQAYGHELIEVVPDLSVSGAVPIREREGIGPWLTPERLGDWDGVITYKLDRLFRSQRDYVDFYEDFCVAHGKVIISAGEGIDTSQEGGKFVADLLVSFAEMERGRMIKRRRDAQNTIRAALRFGGGMPLFGYEAYRDGPYWYLRPHPEHAPIVREVAGRVIKGESVSALAIELNRRGITTPRGKRWTQPTLWRQLRHQGLRGYVLHTPPVVKGRPRQPPEIVLGEDGMPLRREPILDDETWLKLQAALEGNSINRGGHRRNASPLLRVAFCDLCGRPLYPNRRMRRGHLERVYVCPGTSEILAGGKPLCKSRAVPAEWLEQLAADLFLSQVGDVEIFAPAVLPDDRSQELAEADEAIKRLEDLYLGGKTYQGQAGAERFGALMTRLETRRDQLAQAVAARASAPREEPTGRYYRDEWAQLDTQGRRQLMMKAKFTVKAARDTSGHLSFSHTIDEEIKERMTSPGFPRGSTGPPRHHRGPGSIRLLAAYLSAHRTMINGSALCAALTFTERA
jgi:site-specific DNA recombinase